MNKSESSNPTILIAAGGTGGDLFPAIAVMEELQNIIPHLSVHFTGSPDRIESRYLPKNGYSFTPMNSLRGFRGLSSSILQLPVTLLKAVLEAKSIVQKYKPACIICGGNYISLPVGIYAVLSGIPLAIIEPNVKPGKTNALLGKYAKIIIIAFEETKSIYRSLFGKMPNDNMKHCGNPLRSAFVQSIPDKEHGAKALNLDPNKRTLFVFGGSLGARSINQAMIKMIDRLSEKDIQILWQTGTDFKINRTLPTDVHVMQFIDDMPSAYASADLVVCRAGGGTVAELAVCGKPAILIPLPGASNNEQALNAETLHEHGAAMVIEDGALDTELEYAIELLLSNQAKLKEMGENALKNGKPNAAKEAADAISAYISYSKI
ncbi:MAG: undecaprenyldiphospho-muramoylpentapeptide beta-N-acetylglucosaminyltransferase [Bacteroidota bacterium]|jgi:UDP-N-acetylglucosamine--N-acetylmuramyl-(pentapeptide) pyrophosphoryl-undecaprenol N-acetylglucosamine transferase